jgi:hypothetical protein
LDVLFLLAVLFVLAAVFFAADFFAAPFFGAAAFVFAWSPLSPCPDFTFVLAVRLYPD